MAEAMILDIDGTLVDSNYQHVIAWQRAFHEHGVDTEAWKIHRYIGKGGDKMVASVAGEEVEHELGDAVRETEARAYESLIGEVEAFPDASGFIDELLEADFLVVLASSAKREEVEHYLDLLEARDRISGFTTAADVNATKPEPDLVEAALAKAGTRDAAMIGDSIWDVEAARRAELECSAVLTGGFSKSELLAAGAIEVMPALADLDLRRLAVPGLG